MGVKRRPRLTVAPPLSDDLRTALDELSVTDGVDVLDDWRWDGDEGCWTLSCRLTVAVGDASPVPRRTDWVVLVDALYPWGYIHLQPAARNGIEATYPHQNLNRAFSPERLWRTGRICVDTGVRMLGRHGVDREPYAAQERLRWRLQRARKWLLAAANGELAGVGQPFELPDLETAPTPLIAFCENVSSLDTWNGEAALWGTASLVEVHENPQVLAVTEYRDRDAREAYSPRWGTFISDSTRKQFTAAWIRLHHTPHLSPWRAPMTWAELRAAAFDQGVGLDGLLDSTIPALLDGDAHVLLVGFPIPSVIDGPMETIFWQAIQLAALPVGAGNERRGFRPGHEPPINIGRLAQFHDDRPVKWVRTENWDAATIASRGQLPEAFRTAETLLIGGGALGSAVADLLVRGGVTRLIICDDDLVMAGNMVRHTLTLDDVGRYKAAALADRLNAEHPLARIESVSSAFPPTDERSLGLLRTVDVVIDSTGENAAAAAMASFEWTGHKIFSSMSLGLQAWAGFSFVAWAESFPLERFFADIRPWLERQAHQFRDEEWPREGVGCWHPVFPARSDDVWLLAAAFVHHISEFVSAHRDDPELAVFARTEHGGVFTGLRRVTDPLDA